MIFSNKKIGFYRFKSIFSNQLYTVYKCFYYIVSMCVSFQAYTRRRLWSDRNHVWHTHADSPRKVVGKIKFGPVCPRGHMGGGGLRFRNLKMGEICQTAGQIGTKFGTHMRIHLETNIG